MKGISLNSLNRVALLSSISFILSSCSWLTNRESLFSSDGKVEKRDNPSPYEKTVPKKQYDQLLEKYEKLLGDRRRVNPTNSAQADNLMKDLQKAKPMQQPVDNAELVETVDVFAKSNMVNSTSQSPKLSGVQDVDGDLGKYNRAYRLVMQNKLNQALTILKEIESTPTPQIHANVKFLLGEILFKQQEYDLSMQVFEEIIKREAFSSVVLKVLGRLVVCSEKLKLDKKKERYYSLLHDFFERS